MFFLFPQGVWCDFYQEIRFIRLSFLSPTIAASHMKCSLCICPDREGSNGVYVMVDILVACKWYGQHKFIHFLGCKESNLNNFPFQRHFLNPHKGPVEFAHVQQE